MGNPRLNATNTATVTVAINRNNFPPEFLNMPYVATIQRTASTNDLVKLVTVTDRDTVVCHHNFLFSTVTVTDRFTLVCH